MNYRKAYYYLLAKVCDAIDLLHAGEAEEALMILIKATQELELSCMQGDMN